MTLNIIAQLSPPSPAWKDLEIHTFIMIINTIRADWVINGDTFFSHVVNLVWLPFGCLQEFPVNFLLLSEFWVLYLLFSSPPSLFSQVLLAWIISTDCRHVWGWVSYSANSPRPALQGQISIASLALNIGRRPFRNISTFRIYVCFNIFTFRVTTGGGWDLKYAVLIGLEILKKSNNINDPIEFLLLKLVK